MKKIFLLFCICIAFSGCFAQDEPVTFITPKNELLEEGPFLIYFPYDWKISNEVDEGDPFLIKTIYYLRHPKNRHCLITVEIWRLQMSKRGASAQMNHILANKIRDLKTDFKKDGFEHIKARTSKSRLGRKKARKLTVSANKNNTTRTRVLYTIERGNRFYMVSYQWHSDWDRKARKRMIKVVHSFMLK